MSKYCLKESLITDEKLFKQRRAIIKSSLAFSLLTFSNLLFSDNKKLIFSKDMKYSTNEETNTFKQITSYNNFYELGSGKRDPMMNAEKLNTDDWTVSIDGEIENKITLNKDDFVNKFPLEERIYRLRCVEAWSMVIPWVGVPLSSILKKFEPMSSAKYVAFDTVYRPDQMPGQRRRILRWPYTEGLTMEEAMHPLTLMAVGIYGKELLNQNGAPMRLVIPWKYGFKSIKSINKIKFQERQPKTSWNISAPQEYGFYANVNPLVDHPRWSQARERRIGTGFFGAKQPTLPFNGYAEEVADLYTGLNLRKYY